MSEHTAKTTEAPRLVSAEQLRERLRELLPADAVPAAYTISKWAREGRIPSIRVFGRVLYDPEAVKRAILETGGPGR